MKKTIWLVALGIVAFALFALTTLPARVVAGPLAKRGIIVSGVTGSIWKGTAQVVQAGPTHIGAIEWTLHALPLLTGRAVADVKITRADGFAQGNITVASSGRIALSNLTASLPLSTLPPTVAPQGWGGKLNANLASLVIVGNWPESAVGTVEVLDLIGPPRQPAAMGSYKLAFPEGQVKTEVLTGALTDIGGPLQLAGTLELKAANRSYVINGLVATRPDASRQLTDSLRFLEAPDAQGRRPISMEGTL